MAQGKATKSHSEFARWYKKANTNDDPERTANRMAAVFELIDSPKQSEIDSLIVSAFGFEKKLSAEALEQIRKPFKLVDNNFEENNSRELQILAAIALAILLETNSTKSAYASLGIITTHMNGERKLIEPPMELVTHARDALPRISERLRERQPQAQVTKGVITRTPLSKELATKVETEWTALAVNAAINSVAEAIADSVQKTTRELVLRVAELERVIGLQDEESEMLWWTIGERSNHFGKHFSKIELNFRPLLLAWELAEATQELPGPASIRSLLSKAGLNDKTMLVSDAVNACDPEWLEASFELDSSISPILTPIHSAIQRKLDTKDDPSAWIAYWSTSTGIKEKVTAIQLGLQFYYERLQLLFNV